MAMARALAIGYRPCEDYRQTIIAMGQRLIGSWLLAHYMAAI